MFTKSLLPQRVEVVKDVPELAFNPQKPLYSERSSIKMPFFSATDRHLKLEEFEVTCSDGSIWKIMPGGFGLCNGYDRFIFRGLEYLVQQKQNVLENPRLVFTYNELIAVLYPDRKPKSISGKERDRIRKAIIKIRNQNIDKIGSFSTPEYEVSLRESSQGSLLIEAYGFAERRKRGHQKTSDINYVVFGKFYLQSFEHLRPLPLHFEYMRQLSSPIAMALFEKFSAQFWHGHEVKVKYSELAKNLFLTPPKTTNSTEFRRRSRIVLKRPHDELLNKGFFSDYSYENINIPEQKPDYWIKYVPGQAFQKKFMTQMTSIGSTNKNVQVELIKRFHYKRNGKQSYTPSKPEIKWMNELLSLWKNDIEKAILLINFGVKRLNQFFPNQESKYVQSLKQYLEDFESYYSDLLKRVGHNRSRVEAYVKDKKMYYLPQTAEKLPIVSVGKIGLQLGHNLKTCRIIFYNPDILSSDNFS